LPLILIVDDEIDLVWALKEHLERQGYEVEAAHDGLEALEAVQ
jgi:CheY-like chemotaxis protein